MSAMFSDSRNSTQNTLLLYMHTSGEAWESGTKLYCSERNIQRKGMKGGREVSEGGREGIKDEGKECEEMEGASKRGRQAGEVGMYDIVLMTTSIIIMMLLLY